MYLSLNVKPVCAELQGLFVTLLQSYMCYLLCSSYLLSTPCFLFFYLMRFLLIQYAERQALPCTYCPWLNGFDFMPE